MLGGEVEPVYMVLGMLGRGWSWPLKFGGGTQQKIANAFLPQ